jgi:hypothetical protein
MATAGKKSASKRAVKAKPAVAKLKPLTAAQKIDAHGIDEICERVAECVPLHVIASDIGVTKWDLLRYLNSDLHHDAHARARERQADKHAEDILAISDEVVIEATYQGETVRLDVSSAAVARNRLRVDSRKWLAAKMNQKKYGDKQTIDLNADVVTMTDEQRRARLEELTAKLAK